MKRAILIFIFLLALHAPAWATWSIVAVDQKTARVVIASATCVMLEPPLTLMAVQAVVVPGKGVAACQAAIDTSGKTQRLVFEEIQKGTDPSEIIRLLHVDSRIESKQFGIVDLRGRSAAFNGTANGKVSTAIQGSIPGERIFFSIQGNILTRPEVVEDAARAFRAARGTITDRVMAAMEAADKQGGDSRCTCETAPKHPTAPCDGKTSHVAYILLADPKNPAGSSYNDGQYLMYLSVTQGNILPSENANPVRTLRMRYDAYMKQHPELTQ
ncbi:MAG TPA: DUF1028 domain-containing protein [Terriglobia bacterium]|nr:DUF1028 domain-containing protein [Terriglobia bacterium]